MPGFSFSNHRVSDLGFTNASKLLISKALPLHQLYIEHNALPEGQHCDRERNNKQSVKPLNDDP